MYWLPIAIYCILLLPFINVIPSNDGELEFLFANQWHQQDNLLQLLSLHPPFRHMLFGLYFDVFGYQYTGVVGILLGALGIGALYYIGKKLFDKQVALLSSFLLALSGLYVSVGAFSIHDFIVTVAILLAYACYLSKRIVWYVVFASIAVLTKETAIFFAASIFIYELVSKKQSRLLTTIPLIVLVWYIGFVHFSGYHMWNDWNFSSTARQGSMYTIVNNLLTLSLFNKYAYENWLHLFIFNFNWVFWIFAAFSLKYLKKIKLRQDLIPIAIFFGLFFLLMLSFQTFTINRYILPLLPFVYLFASYGISKLPYRKVFTTLIILIALASLSQSIDPISNLIWPKTILFGENLYLNHPIDGDDGITYNMQYLTMMQIRSDMLRHGNCAMPNMLTYNQKTLALLHISSCK